jgi:hypothetical protein
LLIVADGLYADLSNEQCSVRNAGMLVKYRRPAYAVAYRTFCGPLSWERKVVEQSKP